MFVAVDIQFMKTVSPLVGSLNSQYLDRESAASLISIINGIIRRGLDESQQLTIRRSRVAILLIIAFGRSKRIALP